ncbi:MAG: SAM-dependent methyltransferase, partial [Pseudomonadota bacterium]
VTGHDQTGAAPTSLDWASISQGSQMIVIYMGMKHLPQITENLLKSGRDPQEPMAIITTATSDAQVVLETTLAEAVADVERAELEPPAIICIGRGVLLRQALDWQAMAAGLDPRNTDPLGRGRPAESA